jgi:hypothetical protein
MKPCVPPARPEDEPQAAAKALAERVRRFGRIDTELAAIRGEIRTLEGQVIIVRWVYGSHLRGNPGAGPAKLRRDVIIRGASLRRFIPA